MNNSIFVAVTETWLKDNIFDSEVSHNFQDYTILRSDRSGRSGGGVALYLRDDLSGDVIAKFDNDACEALVVRIQQLDHIVVVVYRPPDTRHAEFSAMLKVLDTALCSLPTPTPTISVMGDFNLPVSAVKWLRNDEGLIMPLIANHRENETSDGKQDRLQAQHLVEFVNKHN